MPTFYFDTKNEEQLTDVDAFEFPSADHAQKEAIRYLAEAAVHHITHLSPSIICTVKDDQKRPLARIRLTLEVDGGTRGPP